MSEWLPFNEHTPMTILQEMPSPPKLGEHTTKVTTMTNGALLVVYFDNPSTKPTAWCILPHPMNVL